MLFSFSGEDEILTSKVFCGYSRRTVLLTNVTVIIDGDSQVKTNKSSLEK